MIEFLENDLKVQEQKMLIREKSDEKRNSKQNSDFTIHILLIKVLRRYDIFEMKLMIILQLLVHRNRNYTKKRFQQLRRKDIVFNVYFLENHRALANTLMVNAREVSVAKTYHLKNIQPKSMLW